MFGVICRSNRRCNKTTNAMVQISAEDNTKQVSWTRCVARGRAMYFALRRILASVVRFANVRKKPSLV